MAAGKAVITADRPAVRDYVADGEDAILYEPENPSDLRKKIELLLKEKILRSRLAATGQKKVLANFTSEKFAESLLEIFLGLENNT